MRNRINIAQVSAPSIAGALLGWLTASGGLASKLQGDGRSDVISAGSRVTATCCIGDARGEPLLLAMADTRIAQAATQNKGTAYIDGYNLLDYLGSKTDKSPRREFWYVNDDAQVVAARYDDWKAVFLENRGVAFEVWREPFTELRVPLLFHLRRDPFERAQHNSNTYNDWFLSRAFVCVPLQSLAARFLMTMKEYPPSQTPGSFNLEKIQKQIEAASGGK